jgi:hypothetical protein
VTARTCRWASPADFQFGTGGHFNIAAEYLDGEASNNGVQRYDAAAIIAQGGATADAVRNLGEVVQRYGLPEQETTKVFLNAGYDLARARRSTPLATTPRTGASPTSTTGRRSR